MSNFKIGDDVVRQHYIGKVVGFNGRGWPIVEWHMEDAVLVEDPDNITKVSSK